MPPTLNLVSWRPGWWPRRRPPVRPAWMSCGCSGGLGPLTHHLWRAVELAVGVSDTRVRPLLCEALLLVRREHHARPVPPGPL